MPTETPVIVNQEYLQDIADAIRGKNGSIDTYTPAEMASAINDLETGGSDPIEWTDYLGNRSFLWQSTTIGNLGSGNLYFYWYGDIRAVNMSIQSWRISSSSNMYDTAIYCPDRVLYIALKAGELLPIYRVRTSTASGNSYNNIYGPQQSSQTTESMIFYLNYNELKDSFNTSNSTLNHATIYNRYGSAASANNGVNCKIITQGGPVFPLSHSSSYDLPNL